MTELERAVLAFEARQYRSAAAKELAIIDELGIGATRYYQVLVGLLTNPEAEQTDPVLIHRLQRRLGDERRRRDARPRQMNGAPWPDSR